MRDEPEAGSKAKNRSTDELPPVVVRGTVIVGTSRLFDSQAKLRLLVNSKNTQIRNRFIHGSP